MLRTAPAPALNASWAAMGRSLGASSSHAEDAALRAQLAKLNHRTLLMVGDSSLRNQFMQLARVGLAVERSMPVAKAVSTRAHSGSLSLPYPIRQPDRPDSSNGFWGGFPWLAFSTPGNATFIYAKLWGCADLGGILNRMRLVAQRHRQRSGGFGGWPPHVVLWNFGLHLLHVFPARPVPLGHVRCALGYRALVDESARTLRAQLPMAHLTYRSTNAVCDARFEGPWAVAARAYHCAAAPEVTRRVTVLEAAAERETGDCQGDARLARVQALCQRRYNLSLAECVATFMDARNTRRQHVTAWWVLHKHPANIALLDAYAITDGRCYATVDGRHYPRLLAVINHRWLREQAV